MSQRYFLSKQMQQFVNHSEQFFPESVIERGISAQRDAYDAMTASLARTPDASLVITDSLINGVKVRSYQPQTKFDSPLATVLFAHGGGWYLGGLESHTSFCADVAFQCQVRVIAIDYRLAPEHPFPNGLDDCVSVYQSLVEEGVQPILLGDSAGANLMAALTLRCKAQNLLQARAQVLIYPALAPINTLNSHRLLKDAPLLSSDSISFCFDTYYPPTSPKPLVNAHSESSQAFIFPLHAQSLASLPPAAIFAAQYDPLIDDALSYAERLNNDRVKVHCCVIAGAVHGALHAIGCAAEADQLLNDICGQIDIFKS